jgi:nitrous oxide reductase
MKDEQHKVSVSRRQFLRDAGVTGSAAAVAATLPGAVAAAPESEGQQDERHEGYRLTQHILEYYKTAAS